MFMNGQEVNLLIIHINLMTRIVKVCQIKMVRVPDQVLARLPDRLFRVPALSFPEVSGLKKKKQEKETETEKERQNNIQKRAHFAYLR